MKPSEKRRAQRVLVNLQASYRSPEVSIEGRVANLSRFGLFIRSDFLDGRGAQVTVALNLPNGLGDVEIDGEVVRVDVSPLHSGMGIRFGHMAPPVRRALANFMIERSYQASA